MNDEILYQTLGKVAIISLNRAPANAYYRGMLALLEEKILLAENDDTINVVIINSSSTKFFCAGADIKIFQQNSQHNSHQSSQEQNPLMVEQARKNLALIENSSKIYIAALNGHCLGGGLELALACDFRIGSDGDYLLGLPEIKLGLIPGNGGSQRLTKLIGIPRALELLVTGEPISPKQALAYQLIHCLYHSETFNEDVLLYANKIANGAAKAVAATKKAVYDGALLPIEKALILEQNLVTTLYETEDAKEGFNAFIEKRVPVFIGK